MNYILHIETATTHCSVATTANGQLIYQEINCADTHQHAEKLHLLIKNTIAKSNIQLADLKAIAINKGPGSYTGLRIGVSAAKGLAYALNIPLLSIDSLEILIQAVNINEYDFYIPMLDARRMEVYTTLYNTTLQRIKPIEALILDENTFKHLYPKNILVLGDAALKCKINFEYPNFDYNFDIKLEAQYMSKPIWNKFKQQEWEDIAYFEPFYLKDFKNFNSQKKWF